MPKISEYNAVTGENVSYEVSDAEYTAMLGDITSSKSMAEIISDSETLKASALAKLAALGLTEDEAKAIIG